MNFIEYRGLAAAACMLILAAGRAANSQSDPDALALYHLQNHGVAADTASLEAFLENGFPPGLTFNAMPEEPGEKCQLLIHAMEVVGRRGDAGALNALGQLARATPGPGVWAIIQRDARLAPASMRQTREQQLLEFLQYNAAVALGLIGDHRATPLLRALFDSTSPSNERCQYALSLACLGDPAGLDYLMEEIARANQTTSVAAATAMYYIAELEYGYRASSPIKLRQQLARDYAAWWDRNRPAFQLNPRLIIKRRLEPLPDPPVPPTSVRNLVALAANYLDFADLRGSRTAQERLDKMAEDAPGDLRGALEAILSDEMEDLNVRREAMRRYVLLREDDARKAMKKLREDENPEIREYAENALESIDSGAALSAPGFKAEVVEEGPSE